ncbi:hypothetical protein [Cloacibacillus porcorum]|uniref:hypothetical protein n=1 Tax=Cloacibacillus porcorum TaxID=1197717 RepID=UPI0023F57D11|nr:hypothetical protein [Cloacibacillus porcorum]MCC8185018.1 hypothetical protein [Cloacibacillus porcorum]
MKIIHRPSDDEIRKYRQAAYLAKWPLEKQLEAHGEAAAGRLEKLAAMTADFASIREALPYTRNEGDIDA